jgi:hypothetical protein
LSFLFLFVTRFGFRPWICIYSAYLGINGSFSGATLPTFVDVSRIPTLFLLYSIASILTSWSIGMIFDRWGWPVIVGIQVIGNVFPHISFLSVSNPRTDLPFGYLLAVGAVYGVSDSIVRVIGLRCVLSFISFFFDRPDKHTAQHDCQSSVRRFGQEERGHDLVGFCIAAAVSRQCDRDRLLSGQIALRRTFWYKYM